MSICRGCKAEFNGPSNQIYCSVPCRTRFHNGARYKPLRLELNCLKCNCRFQPKSNLHHYCSNRCRTRLDLRLERNCKKCSAPFVTYKSQKLFCSEMCRRSFKRKYNRRYSSKSYEERQLNAKWAREYRRQHPDRARAAQRRFFQNKRQTTRFLQMIAVSGAITNA